MLEAARTAQRCFQENLDLFPLAPGADQHVQEKWNLYNGLANLAEAVATKRPYPAQVALSCFAENLQMYYHAASTETEKWNLYNGLANLAQAIIGQ